MSKQKEAGEEEEGVTIEFMSGEKLAEKSFSGKLDLVLEKVTDNSVVVLNESWTPEEKRKLIQNSMEKVSNDFPGVEFLGLDSKNTKLEKARNLFYQKILDQPNRKGMTIVGNSRVMEKIKEERDTVSFLAKLENQTE